MPKFKVEYERIEYHTEWFGDGEGDEYESEVADYIYDYEIVDAEDANEARNIIADAGDVVSVLSVKLVEDNE
jgi:hypothetical protein